MDEPARSNPDPEDQGARINPVVLYGSAIGILVFSLWTITFTDYASLVIGEVLTWISDTFGWFYFVAVLAYLVFVIAIGLSRAGSIRLGPAHARPDFNVLTWGAMLFAAGIGIDLLFFCVVEPVSQFLEPPVGEGGTEAAARHALELTFLHWGLSGWGIYALVGMSLAYFSYRQGLPLSFRSSLYPLLGQRIYGPIGHVVDGAAILGTIFGIATSLGIGIIQLNFGLNYVFGIPSGTLTQIALATAIVIFSAISAATGVERGIRRLSEFNMLLALLFVLFVLFAGETTFLLNALALNIGDYLSGFVGLSLNTYAFDPPSDWLNAWTVFFWAWWIAWGPFVGLFLARISRGRTIRQFVAGVLILPLVFIMAWMSIIGNSAIEMVMTGATGFGQQAMEDPGSAIYLFLQNLPWDLVTTTVVTILAIVFFVTSGDSGSLVLANLSSILEDPNSDAPAWMRIMWAAIIGLLTIALLLAGGLTALQSAVVIMGLPFAVVLFLMMIGLYKALRVESQREESVRRSLAGALSGRTPLAGPAEERWAQRLERAVTFPTREQARGFLAEVARPAMSEIGDMLRDRGYTAEISEDHGRDEHLTLTVHLGQERNFYYRIRPHDYRLPSFAIRSHPSAPRYYRLEVHLFEGGQGYDLMGYTREQVIEDILDQFERHLNFLHARRESRGGAYMPDRDMPPGEG